MTLMPEPRQLRSSDWACRRTVSGKTAGPAAKLKTRSPASDPEEDPAARSWSWVAEQVVMEMGFRRVVDGEVLRLNWRLRWLWRCVCWG